jgi:hypothetical protein
MYSSAAQIRKEIDGITIGFVWDPNPGAPESVCEKNPTLKRLTKIRKFAPFTTQQAQDYQKEVVAEYCWIAYQKSLKSTGDMIIGRQKDLARQCLYAKVAEMVREEIGPQLPSVETSKARVSATAAKFGTQVKIRSHTGSSASQRGAPNMTFLDENVHGNLLNQDKWAGPVNDAWLLGCLVAWLLGCLVAWWHPQAR